MSMELACVTFSKGLRLDSCHSRLSLKVAHWRSRTKMDFHMAPLFTCFSCYHHFTEKTAWWQDPDNTNSRECIYIRTPYYVFWKLLASRFSWWALCKMFWSLFSYLYIVSICTENEEFSTKILDVRICNVWNRQKERSIWTTVAVGLLPHQL